METKKASPEWYMAATHWLTAGFVIPLLVSFVGGIILVLVFGDSGIPFAPIIITLISVVSIWLGTIYSSKYLDKTYVIKNSGQIAVLSTVYLVIVGGGIRLMRFIQTGVINYEMISFIFVVLVFYFASKKYIKNNATAIEAPIV